MKEELLLKNATFKYFCLFSFKGSKILNTKQTKALLEEHYFLKSGLNPHAM